MPWCVVTASVSLAKLIPTWFHYLRRLYLSKSIKDSDILILLFFIMIHQSDFFTFQTRSSKPFITWSLQDLDLKFARSRSRSSSTWSLQWHSLWIAASWACTDLQPCCWRKILKFSWTLTRYGWHREQRRNQTFVSKKLLQIVCLHNRMYCSARIHILHINVITLHLRQRWLNWLLVMSSWHSRKIFAFQGNHCHLTEARVSLPGSGRIRIK